MRKPRTLLEVTYARTGSLRETRRVVGFIVEWDVFRRREGRAPESVSEFASWWGENRSTALRHLERFREAFPEFETPDGLLELAGSRQPATHTLRVAL